MVHIFTRGGGWIWILGRGEGGTGYEGGGGAVFFGVLLGGGFQT